MQDNCETDKPSGLWPARLCEKDPEQWWCFDHLKDYLIRNESDLHYAQPMLSFFGLGLPGDSPHPWNPVWCFLGINAQISLKKKNPPNLWLCGKTPEHTRRKTQTLQFGCWSFKAVKWYSSFTSREAASQSSQSKVMFFLSLGLHHFKYMSAIHLVCKDVTWL